MCVCVCVCVCIAGYQMYYFFIALAGLLIRDVRLVSALFVIRWLLIHGAGWITDTIYDSSLCCQSSDGLLILCCSKVCCSSSRVIISMLEGRVHVLRERARARVS